MNNSIMLLMGVGSIPLTSPAMTSNSTNGTGGTYTYSSGPSYNVYNTGVGYAIADRSTFDLGYLNFSTPFVVQSINLGSAKSALYYQIRNLQITLFNGAIQVFQQTYDPYTLANTSQTVSNILATKCHISVISVSQWYNDGGYIGTMNGVSLSGIIV